MFRSSRARLIALLAAAVVVAGIVVALAASGGDDEQSPSRVDASPTVYLERSFAPAVASVRGQAGRDAQLNEITLSARGASFRVYAGRRLRGYLAQPPDYGRAQPFQLGVSRKLLASMGPFPIARVDPAVPERLVRRIKRRYRAQAFRLVIAALRRARRGRPRWTVEALVDGDRVIYTAASDGSRPKLDPRFVKLNRIQQRQRRRARRDPSFRKTLERARAISRCIQEARGDQKKIRECNEKVPGGE